MVSKLVCGSQIVIRYQIAADKGLNPNNICSVFFTAQWEEIHTQYCTLLLAGLQAKTLHPWVLLVNSFIRQKTYILFIAIGRLDLWHVHVRFDKNPVLPTYMMRFLSA